MILKKDGGSWFLGAKPIAWKPTVSIKIGKAKDRSVAFWLIDLATQIAKPYILGEVER